MGVVAQSLFEKRNWISIKVILELKQFKQMTSKIESL